MEAVTAAPPAAASAEVFTVNVLEAVVTEVPFATCATLGLTIPAACVKTTVKVPATPLALAPIPWAVAH